MAATGQLFALVDVNNMYVSCERAFNPKLQNRPVVALSETMTAVRLRAATIMWNWHPVTFSDSGHSTGAGRDGDLGAGVAALPTTV